MSHEAMPINRAGFTLAEVAAAIGGAIVSGDPGTSLSGVGTDTRALWPGNLFVALRGERFDGHDFLQQAAEDGALAAVVEEQTEGAPPELALVQVENTLHALGALARAHRLRSEIPVVAVTGSYGKTTTRALIAAALAPKFEVLASRGNFNNEIGLPQTLLQLDETHGAAVLEMGMRGAGQIAYLADIARPTVGVITNIGPQHVALLGSVENIAAAKAELLESLPADGLAVLPADDAALPLLRAKTRCRVVTFGQSEAADYRVIETRTGDGGDVYFSIQNPKSKIQNLRLPLPGAHNAINAAAALAVAAELGVPLEDAARALELVEVPGARMRIVRSGDVTIIDDCYNAGPNSMRAALETLLDFPGGGRRVAILGAMKELGAWSEAEHRTIGAFAGTFVEALIGVGGETRPLLNAAIDAARQVENGLSTNWCPDATNAVALAHEVVQPGDVVLVKGSRSVGLETVVSALAE